MNVFAIQENWTSICRKFPLVCIIKMNTLEEIQDLAGSYTSQFDHVFCLISNKIDTQKVSDFCKINRVINLSVISVENIGSISTEDVITHIPGGQMILATFKKTKNIDTNIRWMIYDRVKEMKSPTTDVLFLNNNIEYCLTNETFSVRMRLAV